jgi:tetratricopeptide (TPR) repeat protein
LKYRNSSTLQTEDEPEYWIMMGYSLEREGKTDKAQKYYEKALELDPDNFIAMNNRAKILSNQGKNEEALKIFKYLTQTNPQDVEGWINLGILYTNEGNLDEAMACYDKAENLDPLNASFVGEPGPCSEASGEAHMQICLKNSSKIFAQSFLP